MDIKNDLITAYVSGYEAAKYDLDKDGLLEDHYNLLKSKSIKDIIKDGKRWFCLMLKTGIYGR